MFSEKLKELRKQKGKTQGQVAIALRISQQTYANYEAGKREPTFDLLAEIARHFNVSTDYLLGNEITETVTPISHLFNKAPKGIRESIIKLLI